MTVRPLDGIIVVAMEQALAVPFATRQLADLGARIIKIERPATGDFARAYDSAAGGVSSAFAWLNRGKESIELDIKSAEGRETLDALLARADVFIHNISPGAAGRLGLDSATLQRRYPRLISGSVSGYGSSGPMAKSKAYDLLVQAETGLISLTGTQEHPAKVGISIADIAAGMYAYASIVAAIHHRAQHDEALPVDVSLFDSLAEWLGYPLLYTRYGGTPPPRMGARHATLAPYGPFAAGDGDIVLAVQNDREWARFCDIVLERPELASDPRYATPAARLAHRTTLDAMIDACFARLDRHTAAKRLDQASIAHARVNAISDLAAHEQIVERSRWIDTPSEFGMLQTLAPPWAPRGDHDLGAIPALGQHTESILRWLGERDECPVSKVQDLRERLVAFVADRTGVQDVAVAHLRPIGVGRSRDNWTFELASTDDGGPDPLVLRCDPPGGLVDTDRSVEFEILRCLQDDPLPTPRPRWLDADGSWFGRPAMVMDKVEGVCDYRIVNGDRPLEQRRRLATDFCDLLASVHAVDWSAVGLGDVLADPGRSPARHELRRWLTVLHGDQLDTWPELELSAAWLDQHAPDASEVVLVHADFKPGNMLLQDEKIVALLDWELAHLGDPLEDLGWVTQPLRSTEHLIEGSWSATDLVARYSEVSGRAVDPDALHWWVVFSTFKTAVMQVSGLRSFLEGRSDEPFRPTRRVLTTLLDSTDERF
jgi:formyl-CoA transferase